MRFQKMIRMQLILAGLGATFLSGSPARAQQDADPTIFEVSPIGPQSNTSSPTQNARNLGAERKREEQAVASLTNQSGKDATLEANMSRMMVEEIAIFATLLVGIAAIMVYATVAARSKGKVQVPPGSASFTTTTSA